MPRRQSRRFRRLVRSDRPGFALFGSIAMQRAFCPWCEHTALIIDGRLQCCDRPYIADPDHSERESVVPPFRQRIPKVRKDAILMDQEHRCAYCGLAFGGVVQRHGRQIVLKVHWEHVIPWSFDGNKDVVAACQICNAIKHDHFYRTFDEAVVAIRARRVQLGCIP